MALRNTPAFEADADTCTEADAAVETQVNASPKVDIKAWAAEQVGVASNVVPTSTAPANTALALALKKNTALDDLQNVIDGDMLAGMSFGAFPRIVVAPGAFTDKNTGKSLGDRLKIELLSWNFVTIVSPNENNNREANKLIRTSYDGVNLINGEGPVADYVAMLREKKGYTNANAKRYIELYANLLETGKGGVVPEEEQKITQISVPPTSSGPWGAFLLEQRMKARKGVDISPVITLLADSKNDGANTWGVIEFKRG